MSSDAFIRSFISHLPLFSDFSEEELDFVSGKFQLKVISPGQTFIRTGDTDSSLGIILDGQVEVSGTDPQSGCEIVLCRLGKGETIGEMAFSDFAPRSASVKAAVSTRIINIERKNVTDEEVLKKMLFNISRLNTARLRETTSEYAGSLQKQVNLLKEQVQFGTLFVYMIIIFGVNSFVIDIISNHFGHLFFIIDPVTRAWNQSFSLFYERIITSSGILIMGMPVLILISKISFPLKKVIDLKQNLKKTLQESLLVSGLFLLLTAALTSGPWIFSGIPHLKCFPDFYYWLVIFTPDYFIHSWFQEFITRGVMQNSIQHFLKDEKGIQTVAVSSLAFGIMHSHLGFKMVLGSGLSSLIFGFFYLRTKNLLGVSIIHYMLGIIARYLKVISVI